VGDSTTWLAAPQPLISRLYSLLQELRTVASVCFTVILLDYTIWYGDVRLRSGVCEALYYKWVNVWVGQQARARCGNCQLALVAGDPAASKLLRCHGRDTTAAKTIQHDIVFFR